MGLHAEPITRESRFWEQVNILAKEAFQPEEYLAPSELVKMAESDNFDFLALHGPNPFAATGLLRSCFRPRLKRALRENQPHPQETVSNPVFQKKRAIIMKKWYNENWSDRSWHYGQAHGQKHAEARHQNRQISVPIERGGGLVFR